MNHPIADRLLKPEVLGRLPLLGLLNPEELAQLVPHMWIKRCNKQDLVVVKGSASDALMFLVVGRLQVVDFTEDGKEIGLNIFEPGSFFGELALIDGQPRSASVVAIEASVVLFLPKEKALPLIYGNPQISERMLKHFARSIRSLTEYRSLLAIPSAHKRLYALLCQLKKPMGRAEIEEVNNLPTQRQIAIMINTSRETVSRVLAELQQKGILQKQKKTLVIAKPRMLERLASQPVAAVTPQQD